MIDFKEIRRSVAIEHNTLLNPDDPILLSVTVHEQVLQHYVDILVEQNMELLKALEAAQQKGISDAKQTAGRVITEAGDYVSERVYNGVMEAMKAVSEELEERNKSKTREAEEMKKVADKIMTYGLYGLVTLGAFIAGLVFLYFIKS